MNKHTPGPWMVEVLETTTNIEAKSQTVALDVSNNDADLIAAAPDMLEALKAVFMYGCANGGLDTETDELVEAVLKKVGYLS